MAVYGFGAKYGNQDMLDEFLRLGVACVGWPEQAAPPLEAAPPLHDILRDISKGDLVYVKSYAPMSA